MQIYKKGCYLGLLIGSEKMNLLKKPLLTSQLELPSGLSRISTLLEKC